MMAVNPYTVGTPVPPTNFIGRRKEVRMVFRRVSGLQSISIVGERGIGKTSLLRYIYNEGVRREFLPDFEDYIFVFLDLQTLAGDLDEESVIQYFAQGIARETGVSVDVHSYSGFDNLIRKVTWDRNKRVVFLLDEFDVLSSSPGTSRILFRFLRALGSQYSIAYLTTSFLPLYELERSQPRIAGSPFFDIFYELRLGPFTLREAVELISGPSSRQGLSLKPYSSIILDVAGCHPFYLQLACQMAFDRLAESGSLTDEDLAAMRAEFSEKAQPMFSYVLEQLGRSGLSTLAAIARGDHNQAEPRLLRELTRRGYVSQDGDRFRISSSALSSFVNQWLPTKASDAIMTELLREGTVASASLVGLPDDLQVTSLRRFYDEHPELALRLRRNTLTLPPADHARFQVVQGVLKDLADLESHESETFSVYVPKIVETLEEIFSLKVCSTHVDPAPGGCISLSTFDTAHAFEDTALPSSLPILVLERRAVAQLDLDAIRHCLIDHLGPSQHLSLLVLLGQAEDVGRIQHLLDEKLKKVFAYDVIALSSEDLLRFVIAKDPQRELRRLILSKIDLTTVSPFTVTGPTPSNVFVGRESELREISEHAAHASHIVVGGRRIGKSSLLNRLHRIRLPAAGYRTLYYDCSVTPTCESFLAAAIREWQPQPPRYAPATFAELLESPPGDKPLVLLLDEADKLVPHDRANGWRLFNLLRAVAFSGGAQIIFSGERTLRGALQDSTSPLFNFGNEILLGTLDYRAVEELVTRPMKQLEIRLSDEEKIAHRIYDFTSGHPNVVQRLCRRLVERLNERGSRNLTLEDVNTVAEDRQFQEVDFLQTYWEAATPLEKIITLLLSQEAKTYGLRQVRQELLEHVGIEPSATATKEALDWLVDLRSILKRSRGGYSFAVEAFPRVLTSVTTVDDLLHVLVEQYEQTEAEV